MRYALLHVFLILRISVHPNLKLTPRMCLANDHWQTKIMKTSFGGKNNIFYVDINQGSLKNHNLKKKEKLF